MSTCEEDSSLYQCALVSIVEVKDRSVEVVHVHHKRSCELFILCTALGCGDKYHQNRSEQTNTSLDHCSEEGPIHACGEGGKGGGKGRGGERKGRGGEGVKDMVKIVRSMRTRTSKCDLKPLSLRLNMVKMVRSMQTRTST